MTTNSIFLKGQKYFLEGDLKNSIIAFSDALEQGEKWLYSHLNRGIAYLKMSYFGQAIDDFNVVIQENDGNEGALFYRGIAKLNLGESEAAIEDFDRALALNPERGASYLARGIAHFTLGHSAEAERDIHDSHVLNSVEPGAFLEEYIFSNALFNKSGRILDLDQGRWNLVLTEAEVRRMVTFH